MIFDPPQATEQVDIMSQVYQNNYKSAERKVRALQKQQRRLNRELKECAAQRDKIQKRMVLTGEKLEDFDESDSSDGSDTLDGEEGDEDMTLEQIEGLIQSGE